MRSNNGVIGPAHRHGSILPAEGSPPTSRSHHQDSECETSKAPTSSSPPTIRSHQDSECETTMASPASPPTAVPPAVGHSSPTSRSHPRLGAGGHNADDSQRTLDDSLLPADLSPPTGGVKPQWRRRRRAGGEGGEGKDRMRKEKRPKTYVDDRRRGLRALLDEMISSMVVTPKARSADCCCCGGDRRSRWLKERENGGEK